MTDYQRLVDEIRAFLQRQAMLAGRNGSVRKQRGGEGSFP